jgi:hypothetical protein
MKFGMLKGNTGLDKFGGMSLAIFEVILRDDGDFFFRSVSVRKLPVDRVFLLPDPYSRPSSLKSFFIWIFLKQLKSALRNFSAIDTLELGACVTPNVMGLTKSVRLESEL